MNEYDFSLRFSLATPDADPEQYLGRLLHAGCDDALVGIGRKGHIALDFDREAASASEAICSAILAVKKAIPDATLIEVAPDFVGLTDIAQLMGFSRQYMRKLMLANGTTFPAPIHSGNPSIWQLHRILSWFVDNGKYEVDRTLLDVAKVSRQCNQLTRRTDIDQKLADFFDEHVVPNRALS